jgi:NADH dehydrogenase
MFMKRVFITGATGYVGSKIVEFLLANKYRVTCLVRTGTDKRLNSISSEVNIVLGDALDTASIDVSEHDIVIHLVAIIREVKSKDITFKRFNFETAKNMIDKSVSQGVNRFLFMSAAGNVPMLPSGYFKYKLMAENYLKQSGLKWTIFRPSLIYERDIIGKSMGWTSLVRPIFRVGANLPLVSNIFKTWEPISRTEIARAYTMVIEDDYYINKTLTSSMLTQMTKV